MPIYDYRCTQCGHEVEVIHAIHASGPETCVMCGGAMRKALSAPAIHFKGSGWAKKDARTASTSKTKAGAGAASSSDAKSAGSHPGVDKTGDGGGTTAASEKKTGSGAATSTAASGTKTD